MRVAGRRRCLETCLWFLVAIKGSGVLSLYLSRSVSASPSSAGGGDKGGFWGTRTERELPDVFAPQFWAAPRRGRAAAELGEAARLTEPEETMRWAAVLAACTTTLHWPVLAFVGTHTGLPAASLHLLAPGGQPGAVSRGAWRGAPSRCAAEDRAVAPTRSSRRVRCQAGGHGFDGAGDFRFPVRQFVRDDWPGPGLSLLSVCV